MGVEGVEATAEKNLSLVRELAEALKARKDPERWAGETADPENCLHAALIWELLRITGYPDLAHARELLKNGIKLSGIPRHSAATHSLKTKGLKQPSTLKSWISKAKTISEESMCRTSKHENFAVFGERMKSEQKEWEKKERTVVRPIAEIISEGGGVSPSFMIAKPDESDPSGEKLKTRLISDFKSSKINETFCTFSGNFRRSHF